MRPSVLAVSVVAALLMPGAAALADPPWQRDPEYEARSYAGGPPPWAPAHGWRRKHAHYYEHAPVYVVPDLGIELGRCNRDVIGAVLGGVAGGVIGSQVGKGSDRTVATIGGAIAGVLIGGVIGRSMDRADHACVAQTLEQAPARHAVAWRNPDGGALPCRAAGGLRGRPGAHLPGLPNHRFYRGAPAAALWYRLPAAGRKLEAGALTGAGQQIVCGTRHTRGSHPEPEGVLRRWVLVSLMTFGGEAADLEDGGDDEPELDDDEDGLPVLSSSCGQN